MQRSKKKIVDQSDIFFFVTNSDFNRKLATLATKAEFKAKQTKIVQLQAFDSGYFYGKIFFGDDGFQNIFVYQPTYSNLELKRTRVLNMSLVGNQKGYTIPNLHH